MSRSFTVEMTLWYATAISTPASLPVTELVLPGILQLLVKLPCLCLGTLTPAAFLMQLRTQGQTSVLLKSPCNPTYSCSGFNINILTV